VFFCICCCVTEIHTIAKKILKIMMLELAGKNVHLILKKKAKWKSWVLRLLHAMTENDVDRRAEVCEWFEGKVDENAVCGQDCLV
jgi:hypothetical protein